MLSVLVALIKVSILINNRNLCLDIFVKQATSLWGAKKKKKKKQSLVTESDLIHYEWLPFTTTLYYFTYKC